MGPLPVSESLNGSEMAQGPLRNVVVVQGDVAVQGGFQIGRDVEVMGLQHLLDAAVEALDPAVCKLTIRRQRPRRNSARIYSRCTEFAGAVRK